MSNMLWKKIDQLQVQRKLVLGKTAVIAPDANSDIKMGVSANNSSLVFVTYYYDGTPAATNQAFFVAPRAMKIATMSQVHQTAAGGVSTLTITKDTGTTAPAAGTVIQTGSFDLNATANTVQNATLATAAATLLLAAGDRLSVKFANAIQSSAGIVVTLGLTYV